MDESKQPLLSDGKVYAVAGLAVSIVTGVSADLTAGRSQIPVIAQTRHIVWAICYELIGSYSRVAAVSRRDEATIREAIGKYDLDPDVARIAAKCMKEAKRMIEVTS